MNLLWILVVVLVVLALVGAPGIGTHLGMQHSYGYWPSGLGLVLLIVVLVLLLR